MTSFAWPVSLRPSGASFFLEQNTMRMESPLSRASQVLFRPGARWVCRLDFSRRGNDLAGRLDALIDALDGSAGVIALFDWRRPVPRGAAGVAASTSTFTDSATFTDGSVFTAYASAPVLSAAAVAGAELVHTTGWEISAAVLLAGDYVGIGGRLYRVVQDVVSTGSGNAAVRLRPRLRADAASGARVEFIRPTSPFRLVANDAGENRTEPGPFSTYSLTFAEALP